MQHLSKTSPILAMSAFFLRFLLVETIRVRENTMWIDSATVRVVDAVVVTTDSHLWQQDGRSSHVKRIRFITAAYEQAGFLVTVSNELPTQRDGCTAWGTVFELRSIKQTKLSVGCTRYLVAFFEPPLELTMIPSALYPLANRSGSLVVTVTAVTFSCADNDETYRSCPSLTDFCVARRLFCDGADNCGLRSDERDCNSFDEDGRAWSAKAAVVPPITRHRLRSDELTPIDERTVTMTALVAIGVLLAAALVCAAATYFLKRRANRRHVMQQWFEKYFEQYYSLKERAYRKLSRAQLKRSKRILKGGSVDESIDSDGSSEESLALLTWGIRQHLKKTFIAPNNCQRHSVI
uniref:Uncharacterized protein n=1 Tax=Plectus sambesii TaxID=2011161 RepID=A0A914W234_9BILA